jgi:hypothetical protein
MTDELLERAMQFGLLELPGQPQMMHMGTSHLVNDLVLEIKRLRSEVERLRVWPSKAKFRYGDRVRKISGSSWHGVVRGYYSNTLTPEGYAVESEREPGSTQIYPAAALEKVDD